MIETKLEWHKFSELRPCTIQDILVLTKNDGTFLCSYIDSKTDIYMVRCGLRDFIVDPNDYWAYITIPKIKEFHIWLDSVCMDYTTCCKTLNTTRRIMEQGDEEIHTTQLSLLRTSLLDEYRVFLHQEGKQIEITLGECQGTERIIKAGDNLEKLVLGGEFSFANIT